MGITKDNTHWIFILTSSQKPEDRHLNDIVYGLKILFEKGISFQDITLIIDDDKSNIIAKLSPLIDENTSICKYSDFESVLSKINKNNVIISVTGHGNIQGIVGLNLITPYDLLHKIRVTLKAKKVLLLLGQCYAGIFNYMRVTKTQRKEGAYTPHIIIIGATNISTSISVPSRYDNISWHANIMLFAFFYWIQNPVDIDGDKKYSITDAFKFITYSVNNVCYEYEKNQYLEMIDLQSKYRKSLEELESKSKLPADEELESKSKLPADEELALSSIKKILEYRFVHQEPWILNAMTATNTSFHL